MLIGKSIIAGIAAVSKGETFQGYTPADGSALEPLFFSATMSDVEEAVQAAAAAAPALALVSGKDRGKFLRHIADALDSAAEALIERAMLETALTRPRLTGEVGRTSKQLRHFAQLVEDGWWVNARIDTGDASLTPPRPDVRSMLRPLGPVAVFGASNFPLAFSVAGGDTASALAAGNPVVFKAHPAHPGTGELVGKIIAESVAACNLPPGTFSLLFDSGHSIGIALVQHPLIQAVGFTGSFGGGRALMNLAAQRPVPIPVYAEMGSTNPVFILPGALSEDIEKIATGLHSSFTLGGGQFCTKPGMAFVKHDASHGLSEKIRSLTSEGSAFSLLTSGISEQYNAKLAERSALLTSSGVTEGSGFSARPALLETNFDTFSEDHTLAEEVFGPTLLIVHCDSQEQLLEAAKNLKGHLTATVLGTEDDLAPHSELLQVLETKVGRLIFNGYPTGVEVCHSMVHGGPYPATSDGRSTSVGSAAIFRFTRPVAYQGMPQSALPPALQDNNPEKILRLWNGHWQ
jgi:alpha-ketoglutaric semialdehyde dehydrogenase